MKEFDFNDPRAFILPSGIGPFLIAFGAYRSRGEQVMKRHLQIDELDMSPGKKYSLGAFMAAMKELQDQFGQPFMRKMGSLILANAAFPPGIDACEKLLGMLDTAYAMNHEVSGGEIGHYRWAPSGDRRGTVTCDNPYACAMDTGLLESVLERFSPGTGNVTHVEGQCRHKGDDVCVYQLEW
jgi:hypothetical protein